MQYSFKQMILSLFRYKKKVQPVEAVVPLKLYRSIQELPLIIFIDCYCDARFERLVINGSASEQDIKEAWEDLLFQYTELIGGKTVENKLQNLKRLYKLQTKLILIENCLEILSVMPSEEMFQFLYTFGYPIPKKEFNEKNFEGVLKIFIGHFKLDRTNYKLLADVDQKENKASGKMKRNDFTKVLSRIAIAFKMPPINITGITTAQYCNYVLEYHSYCDEVQKQNSKK